MFCKLLILSFVSRSLAITDEPEIIEWKSFLNEDRNITIPLDSEVNDTVKRMNAINSAFKDYVASYRGANNTATFDLFINSTEYTLSVANSTITEDYIHLNKECAVFTADLMFLYWEKSIIVDHYIQVNMTCLVFQQEHHCTAHYTGSWPYWMVLLVWLMIFICAYWLICLVPFCIYLCCAKKEEIQNWYHQDNQDNESLFSIESGYESPTDE